MKTCKRGSAKDERRARRKGKGGRHHDAWEVIPFSPAMDPALLHRVRFGARSLDPGAPWEDVAPKVLPILKRIHQPYPGDVAPLHVQVPPGIWTGFGIDFGPAFAHVTGDQVDAWGVDRAELLATSLDNLRHLVEREPPRIDRLAPDGFETLAIQGQGWGSSLVLLPEVLGPIVGPAPRLLLAPIRNTLLAVPESVDLDFVALLWSAVADGASDELDIPPLRWTGSAVVSVLDRALGLPN